MFCFPFLCLLKNVLQFLTRTRRLVNRVKLASQETELQHLMDVLLYQDLLYGFSQQETLDAFRTGSKGAIKLHDAEFLQIAKIYDLVVPNRRKTERGQFSRQLAACSRHLNLLATGSNAIVYEKVTYKEVRTLLQRIASCDYYAEESVSTSDPVSLKAESASESITTATTSSDPTFQKTKSTKTQRRQKKIPQFPHLQQGPTAQQVDQQPTGQSEQQPQETPAVPMDDWCCEDDKDWLDGPLASATAFGAPTITNFVPLAPNPPPSYPQQNYRPPFSQHQPGFQMRPRYYSNQNRNYQGQSGKGHHQKTKNANKKQPRPNETRQRDKSPSPSQQINKPKHQSTPTKKET